MSFNDTGALVPQAFFFYGINLFEDYKKTKTIIISANTAKIFVLRPGHKLEDNGGHLKEETFYKTKIHFGNQNFEN